MKKMKAQARRLLALIMAMAMCLSLLQGVAFAAEEAVVDVDPTVAEDLVENDTSETEAEEEAEAEDEIEAEAEAEAETETKDELKTQEDVTEKTITGIKLNDAKDGIILTFEQGGADETIHFEKDGVLNPDNAKAVEIQRDNRKPQVGFEGWDAYIVKVIWPRAENVDKDNNFVVKKYDALTLEDPSLTWSDEGVYFDREDYQIRKGQSTKAIAYDKNGKEVDVTYYRLREVKGKKTFGTKWVYATNDAENPDGAGEWVHVNVYGKTTQYPVNAEPEDVKAAATNPGDIESAAVATVVLDDVVANWYIKPISGTAVNVDLDAFAKNKEVKLLKETEAGSVVVQLRDQNVESWYNGFPFALNEEEAALSAEKFGEIIGWDDYADMAKANVIKYTSSYNSDSVVLVSVESLKNMQFKLTFRHADNYFTSKEIASEKDNTREYWTWVWAKDENGLSYCKWTKVFGLIDTKLPGKTLTKYTEVRGGDKKEWTEDCTIIPAGTKVYGEIQVGKTVPQYFDAAVRDDVLCECGDDEGKEGRFLTPEHLYNSGTNMDCREDHTIGVTRLILNEKINGIANGVEDNKDGCKIVDEAKVTKAKAWEAQNLPVKKNDEHTAVNKMKVDLLDCKKTTGKITITNECTYCGKVFKTATRDIDFTAPLMVGNGAYGGHIAAHVDEIDGNDKAAMKYGWDYVVAPDVQEELEQHNKEQIAYYDAGETYVEEFKDSFSDLVSNKGNGQALARSAKWYDENTKKFQSGAFYDAEDDKVYGEFAHYIKEYKVTVVEKPTKYKEGSYKVEYVCNLGCVHDELTVTKPYKKDDLKHKWTYSKVVWGDQNPEQVRDPKKLFGFLPAVYDEEVDGNGYYFDDKSELDVRLHDGSNLVSAGAWLDREDGTSDYVDEIADNRYGYRLKAVVSDVVKAPYECQNGSAKITLTVQKRDNNGKWVDVSTFTKDYSIPAEKTHKYSTKTEEQDGKVVTYDVCSICGDRINETTKQKKLLTAANVSIPSKEENGTAQQPDVIVKNGDDQLTPNKDYTVLPVANAVKPGTYKVTVKGEGDYYGTVVADFEITAKQKIDISTATVTVNSAVENGSNQQPTGVEVKLGDKTLIKGVDYTVLDVVGAKEPGTYDVSIAGIGDYTGATTGKFVIEAKPAEPVVEKIDISTATVTVDSAVENGSNQQPTGVVVTLDGKQLTPIADYVVMPVSGAKKAGTYKVTINGNGNYTGTVTGDFVIEAKPEPTPAPVVQKSQTLKITDINKNKISKKTFKAKNLKKKAASFAVFLYGDKTDVTWSSSNKKIKLSGSRNGAKVTVKKGLKKGTYKITVKAKETSKYKAASTSMKIVVK